MALFVADVRQAHVRDEVRATGGSVYYLCQNEVVEGSEGVEVVQVREVPGVGRALEVLQSSAASLGEEMPWFVFTLILPASAAASSPAAGRAGVDRPRPAAHV